MAQPSVDKGQVRDLATGRFIANGEAVLLLGPPGVEKTRLAVAIGREVIVASYTVLFVPAMMLVATLAKARAEERLEEKLAHFAKPKLLIVDGIGYTFTLGSPACRPKLALAGGSASTSIIGLRPPIGGGRAPWSTSTRPRSTSSGREKLNQPENCPKTESSRINAL